MCFILNYNGGGFFARYNVACRYGFSSCFCSGLQVGDDSSIVKYEAQLETELERLVEHITEESLRETVKLIDVMSASTSIKSDAVILEIEKGIEEARDLQARAAQALHEVRNSSSSDTERDAATLEIIEILKETQMQVAARKPISIGKSVPAPAGRPITGPGFPSV